MRLGLVGLGPWGRNYLRAAAELGQPVTDVLVREPPSISLHSLYAHRDLAHFVDSVDAVIVACGPESAPAICRALSAASKPFMLEKPAALTLADALELDDRGLTVLVAHQHLFAPGYLAFREKRLRDPESVVFATWAGPGPIRAYDALHDYGPHAVSTVLGLFEAPAVVTSGYSDPDGASFELGGAANASIIVSRIYDRKVATLSCGGASYDGYSYASGHLPLTIALGAFLDAVRAGGTQDWRFGTSWAVRVAACIEHVEYLAASR